MELGILGLVSSDIIIVRKSIEKDQIESNHTNLPIIVFRSVSTQNSDDIETAVQVHQLPPMLLNSEYLA